MTTTVDFPRLGLWPAIARALLELAPIGARWIRPRFWLYQQGWTAMRLQSILEAFRDQ